MAEYQIKWLGQQADGMTADRLIAPRTLPGEIVTGIADGKHLIDLRIESPSDQRVKAACPHYQGCGGCQLMHATDSFVADWKTAEVHRALAAQGIETELRPILTSPPQSRRRATFAAKRTQKGALAGFHGRRSDAIVPVPECIVIDPRLRAALPVAEALALAGASRKGALAVTATLSDTGLDVSAIGGKPLNITLRQALATLASDHDLARLAWDGEIVATRHPAMQTFGPAQVVLPPGAFLQATQHGEATLQAAVAEIVAGASRIVDLFAGCGTFALPLARDAMVHAVEGDAEMTAALDTGWRGAQGLKHVTCEARDLFRRPLLPDELDRFDAAVIDPPRAGAEALCRELGRSQIATIAHVSCNPQTFARDARILIDAGYTLDWVHPVDQFRWSAHIELVAAFRRR